MKQSGAGIGESKSMEWIWLDKVELSSIEVEWSWIGWLNVEWGGADAEGARASPMHGAAGVADGVGVTDRAAGVAIGADIANLELARVWRKCACLHRVSGARAHVRAS
eukprot:2451711-Pleurochrysis_carterae.AAC.4